MRYLHSAVAQSVQALPSDYHDQDAAVWKRVHQANLVICILKNILEVEGHDIVAHDLGQVLAELDDIEFKLLAAAIFAPIHTEQDPEQELAAAE